MATHRQPKSLLAGLQELLFMKKWNYMHWNRKAKTFAKQLLTITRVTRVKIEGMGEREAVHPSSHPSPCTEGCSVQLARSPWHNPEKSLLELPLS